MKIQFIVNDHSVAKKTVAVAGAGMITLVGAVVVDGSVTSHSYPAKQHEMLLCSNDTKCTAITQLSDFSLRVIVDIPVTISALDDDLDNFIASFEQAGIFASGETPAEAVTNLRETIAMNVEFFRENKDKLGQEPKRQLSVLREFIQD